MTLAQEKSAQIRGPLPSIRESTLSPIMKAENPKETNLYWFTAHKTTYWHSGKHLNSLAPKT